MRDMETLLRELLGEDAAKAPPPPDSPLVIRRTRRHQAIIVAISVLALITATGISIAGLRAIGRSNMPAARTEERSLNGITMNVPTGWHFVDPVQAGLQPQQDTLPRLIAILSAAEPALVVPCPGETAMGREGFVLTLLAQPLALDGPAARPWPVELEPTVADESQSPCYPEWESLSAEWTTEGRSFEARVGIGPGVAHEDRAALLNAFASMGFLRVEEELTAVVLARGTAGGEEWELIASRDSDGLVLGLAWRTGGSQMGALHDSEQPIHLTSHVFGTGESAHVIVFGAAAANVTRVELVPAVGGPAESSKIIDVPDGIDPKLNAFVVVALADLPAVLNAYDVEGRTVAQETVRGSAQSTGAS